MFFNKNKEQKSIKNILISFLNKKNLLIIICGIIIFITIIYLINKITTSVKPNNSIEKKSTEPVNQASLPSNLNNKQNGDITKNDNSNIQIEHITFGDFYKKNEDNFNINLKKYNLPINIKTDTLNYYDLSRKINLDSSLDDLNNNGFALLDNPFSKQANDFFGVYKIIGDLDVPILITSDFLLYYQENIFKQIFRSTQKNIFYKNLWDISKKLFTLSNTRYNKNYKTINTTNNHIIEGQRLETIYFAILLKLLQPLNNQIDQGGAYSDKKKFSQLEYSNYNIQLPDYLKNDVEKEINLIRKGKTIEKSPVFLYEKDYTKFNVPYNYKNNAKLNNFYLASQWINSLFPLYHKSETCPDCLLDKNDWLINMISACYLAKDFSANQKIKNQWAKIYKTISFFSGLRQGLTYIHYNETLNKLFGENYDINQIFSQDNEKKDENIINFKKLIMEYEFSKLEGGYNKNNEKNEKNLGMRMLQEAYSPNNYIFQELTYPKVSNYKNDKPNFKINTTYCNANSNKEYLRCQGFGLDIINLIYPLTLDNNYFSENTNYTNYNSQISNLRNILDNFDNYSWHNNNFWTNLKVSKEFLKTPDNEKPTFAKNSAWRKKELNTVLGSWVNLQLNGDNLVPYYAENNIGLKNNIIIHNKYNYIEPNKNLILEIIANTNMLLGMFEALGMNGETMESQIILKKLNENLNDIKQITKKELNGQNLNKNDWDIIKKLSKEFTVSNHSEKTKKINFNTIKSKSITENIYGIKLLLIIHEHEGEKIIAIGPVFNYKEYNKLK